MSHMTDFLYEMSFISSPNVYQERYDSERRKEKLQFLENRIIRKNRNISMKIFNINMRNDEMISAFYFESFVRSANENTPVIVFFYGNSWSNKNPVHYLNYCSSLAAKADAVVIAVNYMQPPEYKFPTALENCVDAVKWVIQTCPFWQINNDKIYLFGDCAGANLALSAALELKKTYRSSNIAGMILVDPLFDVRMRTESFEKYGKTPTLKKSDLVKYLDEYIPDQLKVFDKKLNLGLQPDWTKFPPALIINSDVCPLKDDGALLEAKLTEGCSPHLRYIAEKTLYGFLYAKSYPGKKKVDKIIRSFIKNNDISYIKMII